MCREGGSSLGLELLLLFFQEKSKRKYAFPLLFSLMKKVAKKSSRQESHRTISSASPADVPSHEHHSRRFHLFSEAWNFYILTVICFTLRTHLKRLSRKSICYSKSEKMLENCLKMYWYGWNNGAFFVSLRCFENSAVNQKAVWKVHWHIGKNKKKREGLKRLPRSVEVNTQANSFCRILLSAKQVKRGVKA